jgi:hypothetical protein
MKRSISIGYSDYVFIYIEAARLFSTLAEDSQSTLRTTQAWSSRNCMYYTLLTGYSNLKYKERCVGLTGFMDSPWSGSSFTFPSKSLVSKFTILYLMLFREPLLSQDLMKKKHHI